MKNIFTTYEFTPTEFDSREDKVWFANHFIGFLEAGCPERLFTKRFYRRLSLSFGHIAHYDIHGFRAEWFSSTRARAAFIRHTLDHRPAGDPAFTYSDVERAIQTHLRSSSLPNLYEMEAEAELEARERSLLSTLKAKYERNDPTCGALRCETEGSRPIEKDSSHSAGQMSLFG